MAQAASLGAEPAGADAMPLSDAPVEPEILAAETVFAGRVWDVRRERFRLEHSEPVREFVAHPGAVAILALDDDDRVLLIRQYRHPIRTAEWELPAGLLDVEGEPPLDAARRELAEEADLVAERWERLLAFHTTPGGSDERLEVFLAQGLRPADSTFERTEEEADLAWRWVPLGEAVAAVLDGRLENAILQLGVLALHARRTPGG